MGETDWGRNWVWFWWVGPCSGTLYSNFLLMGGAESPPCCLTWGQTDRVNEILVIFFKRSHSHTAALSGSNPAADHRQPMPLPESPGHSWASLGQSLVDSLLLSPGPWYAEDFICSLQESVSQSCVSSGGSVVGLMVISSKRAYAIPRSAAPRSPAPEAVHCWPIPHRRHSNIDLSQSLWVSGSWCSQSFVWALWASLAGMGIDSKHDFAPPTILLGLLLCIWIYLRYT